MGAVSSGDGLRVVNTLDVPTPPLYDLLGSPEQMCECGVELQVADSWSPDSAAPSTVGTDSSSNLLLRGLSMRAKHLYKPKEVQSYTDA